MYCRCLLCKPLLGAKICGPSCRLCRTANGQSRILSHLWYRNHNSRRAKRVLVAFLKLHFHLHSKSIDNLPKFLPRFLPVTPVDRNPLPKNHLGSNQMKITRDEANRSRSQETSRAEKTCGRAFVLSPNGTGGHFERLCYFLDVLRGEYEVGRR